MTKPIPPHVVFVGYAPTVGDTAIGQSTLQGLRRYVGHPIHIYTNRADVFSKLPGMGSDDQVFDHFLPRIPIEEDQFVEFSRYHYWLLKDLRTTGGSVCLKKELYHSLKDAFTNCAGLVFQGGPHWNDKWTNYKKTVQRRYLLETARYYGVPIFQVGVSCGPFNWAWPERVWMSHLFRQTLSLYDLLLLRDRFSLPALQRIGVTNNLKQSTDSAVFLEAYPDERFSDVDEAIKKGVTACNRKKVVVCVRDFQPRYGISEESRRRIIRQFAVLLDSVQQQLADVYFLGTDNNPSEEKQTDAEVAKEVRSLMQIPNATLIETDVFNPSALKHIYGKFDAMISMRLHPAILSLGGGVPSLVLSYDDKCTDFFKQLDLEQFAVPVDDFDAESALSIVRQFLSDETLKSRFKNSFDNLRKDHACDFEPMYRMIRRRGEFLKQKGLRSRVEADDPQASRASAASTRSINSANRFVQTIRVRGRAKVSGLASRMRGSIPLIKPDIATSNHDPNTDIRHLQVEHFCSGHPDIESCSIIDCETIHKPSISSNPLPANLVSREQLPDDRGWWGYSFYDVPERQNGRTFLAKLQDCKVVSYRDPAKNNDFYPAIISSDGCSLDFRELRYRPLHASQLRQANEGRDCVHLEQGIWVTERVYHNHSHWLNAHLPKLIWLKQHDLLQNVILPSRRSKAMDESLDMLGLKTEDFQLFDEKSPLQVDRLAVLGTDRFRPELLRLVPSAFGISDRGGAERRVYISRVAASRRRLLNEEEVWGVLQPLGFERVLMEELSFSEQVQLMSETQVLCAPHGAGLTNMLFCPEGADIIEIADLSFPNPNFYAMAAALGHQYWLLPAEGIGNEHPLNKDMVAEIEPIRNVISRTLVGAS